MQDNDADVVLLQGVAATRQGVAAEGRDVEGRGGECGRSEETSLRLLLFNNVLHQLLPQGSEKDCSCTVTAGPCRHLECRWNLLRAQHDLGPNCNSMSTSVDIQSFPPSSLATRLCVYSSASAAVHAFQKPDIPSN